MIILINYIYMLYRALFRYYMTALLTFTSELIGRLIIPSKQNMAQLSLERYYELNTFMNPTYDHLLFI